MSFFGDTLYDIGGGDTSIAGLEPSNPDSSYPTPYMGGGAYPMAGEPYPTSPASVAGPAPTYSTLTASIPAPFSTPAAPVAIGAPAPVATEYPWAAYGGNDAGMPIYYDPTANANPGIPPLNPATPYPAATGFNQSPNTATPTLFDTYNSGAFSGSSGMLIVGGLLLLALLLIGKKVL